MHLVLTGKSVRSPRGVWSFAVKQGIAVGDLPVGGSRRSQVPGASLELVSRRTMIISAQGKLTTAPG